MTSDTELRGGCGLLTSSVTSVSIIWFYIVVCANYIFNTVSFAANNTEPYGASNPWKGFPKNTRRVVLNSIFGASEHAQTVLN